MLKPKPCGSIINKFVSKSDFSAEAHYRLQLNEME